MTEHNCWICNSDSDSSEHKIKKKDLNRLWGQGPYKDETALVHFKNNKPTLIQGPNSKVLKFEKNLCQHCNSAFIQPFDIAYDEFIEWFENNKDYVYSKRVIDWYRVYGENFRVKQALLFKYFAKCIGCRISDHGDEVPKDIIDLFSKERFETGLNVSFSINEDMALLPEKDMGLGIYPLYLDQLPNSSFHSYYCGHSYKWLDMNYFYMFQYDNSLGAPWVADSRYVYLGFHEPLSPEIREEFKEKIRNRKT